MRIRLRFSIIAALTMSWSMLAGEVDGQVLFVPEERQEQSNWCWAASSSAILRHEGAIVPQCEIVNWVRVQKGWGSGDCCNPVDARGTSCNRGNYLYLGNGSCQDVLGNWGSSYVGQGSALNRAETAVQMVNGDPVMIRYDWTNGGAHALVLHGFTTATDMTNIMDPWYGPYIADFDWVESGSPPGHTWTRSLMGTGVAPPVGGVDVVFIVDVTGSTGGVRDEYRAMIEAAAPLYESFAPASRYALTYFMDFPMSGYGGAGDVAYGIQTDFVNTPAELQTPLDNLPDGNGADEPESQYTAIHQAITGIGVDLNDDADYVDAGEISPTPLSHTVGNLNVYYIFTDPVSLHNSDDDAAYPVAHGLPVPPFDESADSSCSRLLTSQALVGPGNGGMLFAVSLIQQLLASRGGSQDGAAVGDLAAVTADPPEELAAAAAVGPLEELAEMSGGTTLLIDTGNAAEKAQESFDWFYNRTATTPLVPSLSAPGMIVLVLLLAILGAALVTRQRRPKAGTRT
jgi:hypothetical protein